MIILCIWHSLDYLLFQFWWFLKLFLLLYLLMCCVYVYAWVACAKSCKWRSRDHLQKSVLLFLTVIPEDWAEVNRLSSLGLCSLWHLTGPILASLYWIVETLLFVSLRVIMSPFLKFRYYKFIDELCRTIEVKLRGPSVLWVMVVSTTKKPSCCMCDSPLQLLGGY